MRLHWELCGTPEDQIDTSKILLNLRSRFRSEMVTNVELILGLKES